MPGRSTLQCNVTIVCPCRLQCAFGVTTAAEASTTVDACTILVPGYYALRMSGGIVTATFACPQGYYCSGGTPSAAFNPAVSLTPAVGDTTIAKCPDGLWTLDIASISAQQCCEYTMIMCVRLLYLV